MLFPIQRSGQPPKLAHKALETARDISKPFDGEEQIEKTLTSNPIKLFLDVEHDFDAIRDKAQDLLWNDGQDEARWLDVLSVPRKSPECAGLFRRALKRLSRSRAIADSDSGKTWAMDTSPSRPRKNARLRK